MTDAEYTDAALELRNATARAKLHGSVPETGSLVVDAYRDGLLGEPDIIALHVIGELLDRIAALKAA